MEAMVLGTIVGTVFQMLILYFVISSAVKNALDEHEKDKKEK